VPTSARDGPNAIIVGVVAPLIEYGEHEHAAAAIASANFFMRE